MKHFIRLSHTSPVSPVKRGRRFYILAYTVLFCLFAGILCILYAVRGKSFIWGPQADGMRQHYLCLAYYGEFLRQLPSKIFLEHILPMWDFQMGYGSDILTTLHYYTIGDPLNLLSALVPVQYTEYLYDILIILRMYLAGAAFSVYCLFRGNRRIPTLLGSMIYVFSGWILLCGLKHPFFINPCIYFPLLLLGVEKIFKEKRMSVSAKVSGDGVSLISRQISSPWIYVMVVALSAVSNFYFFYMMGILVIVYGIFRYFTLFPKHGWKHCLHFAGTFALYSLAGILLAMPVLLPVLNALADTGRLGIPSYVPQFYAPAYYLNLIPSLFGKFQSHHTILGVAIICLPGIAVLFLRKGQRLTKVGFFLLLGLFCFPFAGHVMNGFSYATNRFSWAMVLFLSYTFVKAYPVLFRLKKKKHLIVAGSLFLYAIFVISVPIVRSSWNLTTAGIAAVIGLIFLLARLPLRKNRSLQFLFVFTAATAGILVNMYFILTPAGNSRSSVKNFVDSGTAYSLAADSLSGKIAELPDISDYRFEQMGTHIQFNSSLLTRLNSGQYFYSLVDGNLNRYQEESGFNRPYEQRMQNQNGRAFLMKLASMRYFAGREKYVPYGFEKLEAYDAPGTTPDKTRPVAICEDTSALPFAYTYDSYIPEKSYQSMSIAARQQAMMQGVVLSQSELPVCTPEDISSNLPYKITKSTGLTASDGQITVEKPGAVLTLSFKGLPACETYVIFEGLGFDTSADEYGRTETVLDLDLFAFAESKKVSRRLSFVSEKNNFYSGRKCFVGNLGYQKNAFSSVSITFPEKGIYSFDSLTICCQPMERLNDYAAARKANLRSLPVFSTNELRLDIALDKPRAVVFSIPYSKGWNAWINGEPVPLKQANTLYMAVEVKPGNAEIILRYHTPLLLPGIGLCAVGIILLVLLQLYRRSRKIF